MLSNINKAIVSQPRRTQPSVEPQLPRRTYAPVLMPHSLSSTGPPGALYRLLNRSRTCWSMRQLLIAEIGSCCVGRRQASAVCS